MRIGIDATCWSNKRGFGRFTRELLEAVLEQDSANDYLFFVDRETAESDEFPRQITKIVANTEFSPTKAASADGSRSPKDLWAMSRTVWKYPLDIFFSPAVYSYFPVFNRTNIIVTLHDVIADHHPELIFPNKKSHIFWKLKQSIAIRQAKIILTVSENAKEQIIEYFKLPPSRLRVINEAARSVFKVLPVDENLHNILEKYRIKPEENFLLYVGGISPHKNLNSLIDAFQQIKSDERFANLKLVLVGDYKDDPFYSAYPALKKQVENLYLNNNVVFTGFVEDEDLAYLYNAATMVVLPSLEEGFGLPAVEAMACGTPVAASRRGSLPEVLGDAGVFFEPLEISNISEIIISALMDQTKLSEMARFGIIRSKEFMWKKAAKDLLSIFNEFANK